MARNHTRKPSEKPSTLARLRRLGALSPDDHAGFREFRRGLPTRQWILPFRKPWPATLILAASAAGLSLLLLIVPIPAGSFDDLFDLTSSLFMMFWALGWLAGIFIVIALQLASLFAREVMMVSDSTLCQRL
jgi:hypothetical protein